MSWYASTDTGTGMAAVKQTAGPLRTYAASLRGRAPTIGQVLDVGFLLDCFELVRRTKGAAAGPDRVRPRDVGRREMAILLRFLAAVIRAGDWRPGPTRPVEIPKAGGGVRRLDIPGVLDRVLALGLQLLMGPFWEKVFADVSHGFRPKRSHLTALAALDAAVAGTGAAVVGHFDIEKAFPSACIDDVMAAHRRHLDDEALLRFITTILQGNNPGRNRGLFQGNAYSPAALNALLHEVHDRRIDELERAGLLFAARYVDNHIYLTGNTSEGRAVRDAAADMLGRDHLRFKSVDSEPVDLREHHAEALGFMIRVVDGKVRYAPGRKAWERLDQSLARCHQSANPPAAARDAVRGWVNALGPALECSTDDVLNRILALGEKNGFREPDPIDTLRELGASSHRRWTYLREWAIQKREGRPSY